MSLLKALMPSIVCISKTAAKMESHSIHVYITCPNGVQEIWQFTALTLQSTLTIFVEVSKWKMICMIRTSLHFVFVFNDYIRFCKSIACTTYSTSMTIITKYTQIQKSLGGRGLGGRVFLASQPLWISPSCSY